MLKNVLLAWLGNTDIRAANSEAEAGLGPIAQAADKREFAGIHLLSDHEVDKEKLYLDWFRSRTKCQVILHHIHLTGPTEFAEIYEAVTAVLVDLRSLSGSEVKFVYHLSPGTPAMAAVWILLAKTAYPAELIESSLKTGVRTVSFPFDIAAEYVPPVVAATDDELIRLTQGLPPEVPEFHAIVHRCQEMKRAIAEARRIAVHDVPVVILGETGTGKELFARAIHESSPRKGKPFVEVNCAAIPDSLFEAEFFGHTKGAFTDAKQERHGYLLLANGGTLFLDEVGDLPLPSQVKLLRVLQEGKVRKIGATEVTKTDIRVIAATNRILIEDVGQGRFREDLFHRLAVGVLQLPPLRGRAGDMNVLIDYALEQLNRRGKSIAGWTQKEVSAAARNLLHQHPWPGNVRELFNTVSRAAIWSAGPTIEAADVRRALFPVTKSLPGTDAILNRSLGNGFDLQEVVAEVARNYLKQAYEEAGGTKSIAYKLLGFSNATTLTNWMKKYGIED